MPSRASASAEQIFKNPEACRNNGREVVDANQETQVVAIYEANRRPREVDVDKGL